MIRELKREKLIGNKTMKDDWKRTKQYNRGCKPLDRIQYNHVTYEQLLSSNINQPVGTFKKFSEEI